jgi:Ion channel
MFAVLIGAVILLLTLVDCFEAVVLPRRVTHRWRPTRLFYRATWRAWRWLSGLSTSARVRDNALSLFGPLSLLCLLVCWAASLIVGFALIQWGGRMLSSAAEIPFSDCLYNSGETFYTLGYGDITPTTYPGKLLAVIEAGTGFGFMAIVIGYLPVLYQTFSHRELSIGLLDARAGSPPTAAELLRRCGPLDQSCELEQFLAEWEVWAAELLESHLSYPLLAFYRSQHGNQSWLAALAMILDSAAVLLASGNEQLRHRAELTFAMARHAAVDLCLIFKLPPRNPRNERITLAEVEVLFPPSPPPLPTNSQSAERLNELRALYEPFLQALSDDFLLKLPRFFPEQAKPDNWQTSAWTERAPGITELSAGVPASGQHFG